MSGGFLFLSDVHGDRFGLENEAGAVRRLFVRF
jgi:hypothetical protein